MESIHEFCPGMRLLQGSWTTRDIRVTRGYRIVSAVFMIVARLVVLSAVVVFGGTLVFRLLRFPAAGDENPDGLDPVELVGRQLESGESGRFVSDELVGVPFRAELRRVLKQYKLLVLLVLAALVGLVVLSAWNW